ncbi:MAG: GNAT family N-acetyltransferase [Verrucomicrobiales bacterium]|nr:GNAT family N-acetyltransferase [Verrucomicrobiales bacterium]
MIVFRNHPCEVINHLNGDRYTLESVADIDPSQIQVERITSICNEPAVFSMLFSEMFPEGRYPESAAREFLNWVTDGWQQGTHFVFATLDSDGLVVSTCDIKSDNIEEAEIGYLCSSAHSGVMTNSVKAMTGLGIKAGFENFFALVRVDNIASQRVLERVGFHRDEEFPQGSNRFRYMATRKSIL